MKQSKMWLDFEHDGIQGKGHFPLSGRRRGQKVDSWKRKCCPGVAPVSALSNVYIVITEEMLLTAIQSLESIMDKTLNNCLWLQNRM